ncbi:hypothetical protein [Rossellomorea sp. LJF3]
MHGYRDRSFPLQALAFRPGGSRAPGAEINQALAFDKISNYSH